MNSTQIQNEYAAYKTAVDFVLHKGKIELAQELYNAIKDGVLKTDQPVSDEIIQPYKELVSRLRAHIYRRFPTREIPKVFKNDIAHILHKRSYYVIQDVSFYLDRFKIEDDFARQQRTLVNSLLENKQRLTENSIIVDEDKKVAPTVGNWIKYFYRKVGGQQTMNRIKIAEFFSKDSNIVKLSQDELHKVKNLIQLQEYLRRPTEELRRELLEIMIEIGDGKFAVFEDGDFSILFGLEEANFYEQRYGKKPEKDDQGLSEVDALVRQTKAQRPKRTDLKPISSSVKKENNESTSVLDKVKVEKNNDTINKKNDQVNKVNTVDTQDIQSLQSEGEVQQKTKQNTQDHAAKKQKATEPSRIQNQMKHPPQRVSSATHSLRSVQKSHEVPKPKVTHAQKEKTQRPGNNNNSPQEKAENPQTIVEKLLHNEDADEKKIKTFGVDINKQNYHEKIKRFLQKPNKFEAIALLRFIAQNNLWTEIHEIKECSILMKDLSSDTDAKMIACVIHTFLEKHGIMNKVESARIAAQLTNDIHSFQEYKDVYLVYFDMATQSFHWYVNL